MNSLECVQDKDGNFIITFYQIDKNKNDIQNKPIVWKINKNGFAYTVFENYLKNLSVMGKVKL